MKNYKIIEHNGMDPTGTVLHTIKVDEDITHQRLSYEDALLIVETALKPGDIVEEIYQSSGRNITYSFDEFMDKRKAWHNFTQRIS